MKVSIENLKVKFQGKVLDIDLNKELSINENLIDSLFDQGAKINSFGVGENLITAKSDPVFGAVYKLVAIMNMKLLKHTRKSILLNVHF